MATFIVRNTNDSGTGSLRQAVIDSNATASADTIVFDAALAGQTIVLTGGELALTADITIDGDVNGDNKADITISGNNASRIFNISGTGTDAALLSLTMTEGKAGLNGSSGGAVYGHGGASTLLVQDSTISNSTASFGGGLDADYMATSIVNATLSGNYSARGGGIYTLGGSLTAVNMTIHGNQAADYGGGFTLAGTSVTITNGTITSNTVNSANTGGGFNLAGVNPSLTLVNSVVAENHMNGGADANDVSGSVTSATNSAFSTAVTITTDNGGNLMNVASTGLGALQDNGGTVFTRDILSGGSPLVNAGSNAGISLGATDANGHARIGDGTVDIGATEFTGPLVVTTANDVVDANDGLLSLREAVALANAGADADTITFAANLAGQTITLTGGELALTDDVTIDGDTDGDNKADITISGNNASRILNISGSQTDVDVLSLTLTHGNANDGGAIYANRASSLDIADTTISNSVSAARGGGIFVNYVSAVTLSNNAILGNVAGTYGGGIYLRVVTATISNTTIDGNQAGLNGGGISSSYATANIFNSTLTSNHANSNGGGFEIFGSTITATNSIMAANTSGTSSATNDVFGTLNAATNSAFGTTVTITTDNGGNLLNIANIGLGALQDNGGTVATRNILDGSPLLNAGSNAGLPGGLTEDANGALRIFGGTVDIGATELQDQAPVITSNGGGAAASISVAENATAVTTVTSSDPDAGATKTFSISGADAGLFTINSATGVLAFNSAPDFEAPGDTGANNIYDVTVKVSDGTLTDTQAIAITVTNQNEAPVITSNGGGAAASISIVENGAAVTTVTSSDPDAGAAKTFSISGTDAGLFTIDSATGLIAFKSAPDFDAPADNGANNVYDVTVTVSDGTLTDTQAIAVTVTNQNEAPVITSNGGGATAVISLAENSTAVTTVAVSDPDAGANRSFSLGGVDAALFAIDRGTGALIFLSVPDFETPADSGGDNVYDVTVQVTDGSLTDNQDIAVTVTNLPGVVITGTAKADTVTSTKTIAGQPLPTGEEDRINSLAGDDILNGLGGNDTLKGGANDDTLKGGGGADRLDGGNGDDLLIGGSGSDIMTGDAGADRLKGGGGDDRLSGGKGIDRLAGNGGADTFVLTNKVADHDIISGFSHASDSLEISAAKFGGGLKAGHALASSAFVTNATGEAGDANDRFIFDSATKSLFFDADGTGAADAVLIAVFTGAKPLLVADDFLIV